MTNDLASEIIGAVENVTKDWARQRKREERQSAAAYNRRESLCRTRRITIKEAAYEVMKDAYEAASGRSGMATPRQVYYQARPSILQRTGKDSLDGMYFSQTLLVDYMLNNPETTASWDVIWDDRGHFSEPHTGEEIGLGTLAVRKYLSRAVVLDEMDIAADANIFPTIGPTNRFAAILFVEKEGFLPLFDAVHLAERYDLAIMGSKGLSTTAARTLLDRLCGEHKLPLLVLHDLDKSGFSILGTLMRDNRRYTWTNSVQVIDLGLRLGDVRKHNLQSEPVAYGKSDPALNLRENGATEDEIEFLVSGSNDYQGYSGERVELNAFTSDALIEWIEGKLRKHKIKKVFPDEATLERAYRRAAVIGRLPEWTKKEIGNVTVPDNLTSEVRRALRDNPVLSWDAAIAELAQDDL